VLVVEAREAGQTEAEQLALLAQPIWAVAAVAAALGTVEHRRVAALAAQALSSFATQTHMQPQHQPQAHPQSLWLVATVSINGQVQGALHSDGTLCKT
jgi:hypothetical protein